MTYFFLEKPTYLLSLRKIGAKTRKSVGDAIRGIPRLGLPTRAIIQTQRSGERLLGNGVFTNLEGFTLEHTFRTSRLSRSLSSEWGGNQEIRLIYEPSDIQIGHLAQASNPNEPPRRWNTW